jgi:hypothetical protein
VAANAARLCEAVDAQIVRVEGSGYRHVASHGSIPVPETNELTDFVNHSLDDPRKNYTHNRNRDHDNPSKHLSVFATLNFHLAHRGILRPEESQEINDAQ